MTVLSTIMGKFFEVKCLFQLDFWHDTISIFILFIHDVIEEIVLK
jgi:hypothetical protein